jgi:AcrR family transcriptional regulator
MGRDRDKAPSGSESAQNIRSVRNGAAHDADTATTDRRVRRTRQSLRSALIELMLERSYDRITVQDLLDRADVGRSTFYDHYRDKDDLLVRGVADILDQVPDVEASTATLRIDAMLRHSRENQQLLDVMFRQERYNPVHQRVSTYLLRLVEQRLAGRLDDGYARVPTELHARFLTGGVLALVRWWHDNDFPYSEAEMDAFFQVLSPATSAQD